MRAPRKWVRKSLYWSKKCLIYEIQYRGNLLTGFSIFRWETNIPEILENKFSRREFILKKTAISGATQNFEPVTKTPVRVTQLNMTHLAQPYSPAFAALTFPN